MREKLMEILTETCPGEDSQIDNALIADGCMLEGNVKDSVLFRNVTVDKDAEVKSCIIFNDTVVGQGTELVIVALQPVQMDFRPGAAGLFCHRYRFFLYSVDGSAVSSVKSVKVKEITRCSSQRISACRRAQVSGAAQIAIWLSWAAGFWSKR